MTSTGSNCGSDLELTDPPFNVIKKRLQRHHTVKYLKKNQKKLSPLTELKPAGVLVPLFYKNGEVHVLLTKVSHLMLDLIFYFDKVGLKLTLFVTLRHKSCTVQ